MAKNDNLKDFLTDVADAIREKKGTEDLINPQNFSDEIRSIQSGGEQPSVEEKDVNFYDYDGTLLFSYTIAEAQALTELPTPKGHEGLVFQGWNWEYEDVIALDYPMDIGATYITDDGATRLYIKIENRTNLDVPLFFSQSVERGVEIDWGDGSPTETYEGTIDINVVHHYNNIGDYCISLMPIGECVLELGILNNNTNHNIFGFFYNVSNFGKFALRHIRFGRNVKNRKKSFSDCYNLKTVTLHKGISLADNIFYGNAVLDMIVYPIGLAIPLNILTFSKKASFPMMIPIQNGKRRVTAGSATGRYITKLCLPDSAEYISTNACRDLSATYLRMPKKLATIDQYGVDSKILKIWDFRWCEQIPVNNNATNNDFNEDYKIIVPDALYEEWITATNWSLLAEHIIKASDYVEP